VLEREAFLGRRQIQLQPGAARDPGHRGDRGLAASVLVGAQHRAIESATLRKLALCEAARAADLADEIRRNSLTVRWHTANVADSPQISLFVWRIRYANHPMATIRSIGTRALAAVSGSTLTSKFPSRSASRSFGNVIIFMNTQEASALAGMNSTSGAAIRSG